MVFPISGCAGILGSVPDASCHFALFSHCLLRLHYPRDCRQISRTGGIFLVFFWLCSTRVKSVLACIKVFLLRGGNPSYILHGQNWMKLSPFVSQLESHFISVSLNMCGVCAVGETKLLFRYLLQVLRYLLRSLIEHESCHKRSQQVSGMQMYKPAEFIWFLCQLTLYHSHWFCADTVPSFGACISCWLPTYDYDALWYHMYINCT